MQINDAYANEQDRAAQQLLDLAGEDVDAIDVKSVRTEEAPFLAKIVSKLSPMVGNLMEQRIVEVLDQGSPDGFSWHRQDPGFPDAILRHQGQGDTHTGFEIKAWYVLSTEITGRFKESQNLLTGKNVNVVIVAWCMSHLIFGKPKILGVLNVSGSELAASRDRHYHKPPEYLTIEPQDTTARTANLQQSNVNGYKLQISDSDPVVLERIRRELEASPVRDEPHTPASQAQALDLMNKLTYRLDTNFAKIDRVANPDVERFKAAILSERYLGKTFTQWKRIFRDLNDLKNDSARIAAEEVIVNLYGDMLRAEPKTEVAVESPGAQ